MGTFTRFRKHFSTRKKDILLRLFVATGALLCFAFIFGQFAEEVIEQDTLYADEAVLKFINGFSTPFLDQTMVWLTALGGVLAVVVAATALTIYRGRQYRWRSALFTAFSIGGLVIANSVLKLFYQRERPELWSLLVNESTYSFPSGHAALSCGLAIVICILVWRSKYRIPIITISVIYVAMIGFTRLYLGVHYPTDVFAGWLLAIVWVGITGIITGVISYEKLTFRVKKVRY